MAAETTFVPRPPSQGQTAGPGLHAPTRFAPPHEPHAPAEVRATAWAVEPAARDILARCRRPRSTRWLGSCWRTLPLPPEATPRGRSVAAMRRFYARR